jgi:hypothetical protein
VSKVSATPNLSDGTKASNWWRSLSFKEKLIMYHTHNTNDHITFHQFCCQQKLIFAAWKQEFKEPTA